MRLRVRFPDGQAVVLSGLRAHITYNELITEISKASGRNDLEDPKVARANAPGESQIIQVGAHGSCKPRPEDGDTLRIEPKSNPNASRPSDIRGTTRVRGHSSATSSRDGIASLAGLRRGRSNSSRGNDYDDSRDFNWVPDLADKEPEISRKRARRGRGRGMVLGDGSTPSRVAPPTSSKRKKSKGLHLMPDALLPSSITANLGVELARAATGAQGTGMNAFRNVLASELEKRQLEATGERRFAAALANSFQLTEDKGNGIFSVKYRARGERTWETDENMPLLEQNTLAAVVQSILNSAAANPNDTNVQKSIEFLRGREMSHKSPRVFWNLVRLFGGDVEDGLRELLPDHDWSFLRTRRRELSEKAKRNLMSKDE